MRLDAGRVGLITVIPTTSPQAAATSSLITTLRDHYIPDATHGRTSVYVGGLTAIFD